MPVINPVNKLVRDYIPKIIELSGDKCSYRILEDSEYIYELDKKIVEEFNEFKADHDVRELADLLEVVYAYANYLGVSICELNSICQAKRLDRGGFSKKIYLESVIKY